SYISSNNLGFPTAQGPGYLTHYAGSYGGLSGALSNHNYIYGSSLEPSDFGSGGLDGPGSGHIRIISENFNLEGYISSSTTSGSNRRGSGGSIYVTTDYLSGTGYFIATSSGAELGGGGGRIAVYYNESTFTGIGQSSVAGGLGNSLSNRGQAGTFIYSQIDSPLNISAQPPTPLPGEGVTDEAIFNYTTNNTELSKFIFNWNGQNYSLFDSSLKVFMPFDIPSNVPGYVRDYSRFTDQDHSFERRNDGYLNREYFVYDEFTYRDLWSKTSLTSPTTNSHSTMESLFINFNSANNPTFFRTRTVDTTYYDNIEIRYKANLDQSVELKVFQNDQNNDLIALPVTTIISDEEWHVVSIPVTGWDITTTLYFMLDNSDVSGYMLIDYIKFYKELPGDAEYVDGVYDQALYLDGNSFVEIPYISNQDLMPTRGYSDIGFSTDFGISFWVNREENSSGEILNRWGSTNAEQVFRISITNDTLYGSLRSGNNLREVIADDLNISDNEWYHVAFRRLGAECAIYLNGDRVARNTNCGGGLSTTANQPIRIGMLKQGATETYFNGSIDDLRIYSRNIDEDEIDLLTRSNLRYLGNKSWNFVVYQPNILFGEDYNYEIIAYDKFSESTSSGNILIKGNSAPTFPSIISNPTVDDLNALDPNVEVTIFVNISDTDGNLAYAYLEWRNSTQDWTDIPSSQNISVPFLPHQNFIYAGEVSFILPSYEDNITYRFTGVDYEGAVGISEEIVLESFWDCSWHVEPLELEAQTGYFEDKNIGSFTIYNTGDSEYFGGCHINFTQSYIPNSFSSDYISLTSDFDLWSSSMRYLMFSERNVLLTPGDFASITVTLSIPKVPSDVILTESPIITINSNKTDTVSGISVQNISSLVYITVPGEFLYQNEYPIKSSLGSLSVQDEIIQIPLHRQNFTLNASLANIGADNTIENTAYNVSFNWTFPSNFIVASSTVSYSIATQYVVASETITEIESHTINLFWNNLSNTSRQYNTVTISLNELNLPDMINETVYLRVTSGGFNQDGDIARNPAMSEVYETIIPIRFICSSTPDGILVQACGSADGDYVAPTPSEEPETWSNPGGGGGSLDFTEPVFLTEFQREALFQTNSTYELVRGSGEQFQLVVENTFAGPMLNLSLELTGFLSQYIDIYPNYDLNLAVNESTTYNITISAPEYFTDGFYELLFVIRGVINTSRVSENRSHFRYSPIQEQRNIELFIVPISREKAESLILKSNETVNKLLSSGFNTIKLNPLLRELSGYLRDRDYSSIIRVESLIQDQYNYAIKSSELLHSVNESMHRAYSRGLSTPETERLLLLAHAALNRGEFQLAHERAVDAELSLALETVGKFNVWYFIKNNWVVLLFSFIALLFFTFVFGISLRYFFIQERLKVLNKENHVVLGLIKELQYEFFEQNKISMEEYKETISQYEHRINKITQQIITNETARKNLLKFLGNEVHNLLHEKDRIMNLMKEVQYDYIETKKLDTRAYENRMQTYQERLVEIEERLITIEADNAMKKSHSPFGNLFAKSNQPKNGFFKKTEDKISFKENISSFKLKVLELSNYLKAKLKQDSLPNQDYISLSSSEVKSKPKKAKKTKIKKRLKLRNNV
ncbi:MAG: LamG-like jellyroll fold domain-containing protein, partial [Candidatus Woesearchaeota archaeon]